MTRAAALLLLAGGCHRAAPERTAVEQLFADDPIAVFGGLEEQLTTAREVTIDGNASSTGYVETDLDGTIHVRRDSDASIEVDGSMQGSELARSWHSKKPTDPDLADVQPPTWADGILLGATRMGVLHNWATVIGGGDPDIGHGDMTSYVEVADLAWKDGDPATRTLTFRFVVEAVTEAEAELTLDERGLPTRRTSTVHFLDGDMHVVETYARFDVRP